MKGSRKIFVTQPIKIRFAPSTYTKAGGVDLDNGDVYLANGTKLAQLIRNNKLLIELVIVGRTVDESSGRRRTVFVSEYI